jgi:hypothetical protein
LLCAAGPGLRAEGFYAQGGARVGAVITGRVFPLGGFTAGAGYALPLGAGELSLGAETGFVSAAAFTLIPAALSAAYDISINQKLSVGGGLLAGGCFVLDKGARTSPLIGGRLRVELKQSGRAAAVYIAAGMDISPERTGAALLPVFDIGLRMGNRE